MINNRLLNRLKLINKLADVQPDEYPVTMHFYIEDLNYIIKCCEYYERVIELDSKIESWLKGGKV